MMDLCFVLVRSPSEAPAVRRCQGMLCLLKSHKQGSFAVTRDVLMLLLFSFRFSQVGIFWMFFVCLIEQKA